MFHSFVSQAARPLMSLTILITTTQRRNSISSKARALQTLYEQQLTLLMQNIACTLQLKEVFSRSVDLQIMLFDTFLIMLSIFC